MEKVEAACLKEDKYKKEANTTFLQALTTVALERHFMTGRLRDQIVVVVVNHCFTSLFSTNGLLSKTVIR